MSETTKYVWDIAKKENDDAIAKIRAAKTTDIYALPAAEKAVWRKAMQPLYREFEGVLGKDTLQEIEKTVQQSSTKKYPPVASPQPIAQATLPPTLNLSLPPLNHQ